MTQKIVEKLNRKIATLGEEVKSLRSFVIGSIAKDKEGEYRSEFVKKVLKNSKREGNFVFKGTESFLRRIQKTS